MASERSVLALCAALATGCVSHSAREDLDAMREVLETRSELAIVERDPEAWDREEPALREILARPLDGEGAVRVAILGNRELRARLAELGIARGELVQAGLLPNPTIHGEARIPESGEEPTQLDFGIAIDLTDIVLAPLRAEVAGARLEAQRIRVAGEVLDVAYRARVAFLRTQARAQQLELRRTAMDSFAASVTAIHALRDAGNVRDLDVAIEEAAYEEARIEVARAELELFDERERLNVILGVHGEDAAWEIAGRMADPAGLAIDDGTLEQRAVEASLELLATRAELVAIGRSIGLARTEGLVPDIELGFHAELDQDRFEWGPEVSMSVPIFSQGQGRVLSREAELSALRERYVGTAITVRAAVRAARNRAVTAELLARRHREVLLPARTRIFEETLRQYNAMQLDVFRLLAARQGEIDTARATIDAVRDYWIARATLEQILAGRLAGTIVGDAMPSEERAASRSSSDAGH